MTRVGRGSVVVEEGLRTVLGSNRKTRIERAKLVVGVLSISSLD